MTEHLHLDYSVSVGFTGTVNITVDVRGHQEAKRALTFVAHSLDLADAFLVEPAEQPELTLAPEPQPECSPVPSVEESPDPSPGDDGEEARAEPFPARASEPTTDAYRPVNNAGKLTHRVVVLDALVAEGGTWEGAGAALARHLAGDTGRNPTALKQELTKMARDGLVAHEGRRLDGTWSLTGDGWRAAGATPPKLPAQRGRGADFAGKPPKAEPEPDTAAAWRVMGVTGPIVRTRFDPEAARAAAASAL